MTLDVGNRVRKARKSAGLTQNELAKKASSKQAVISDIENGRNKNSSALYDIAIATGVNPNWLLRGKGERFELQSNTTSYVYPDGDNFKIVLMDKVRRVPVLNYVQAGEFCEYFDDAIADMFEVIIGDYPPHVHWIIIEGLSMTPDFNPGDLILVDPDTQPSPGDYVVAKKAGENAVTFKKWRPRGFDDDGVEYCELVPLNHDFPIIDSRHIPFTICGVAVEHKKKLK